MKINMKNKYDVGNILILLWLEKSCCKDNITLIKLDNAIVKACADIQDICYLECHKDIESARVVYKSFMNYLDCKCSHIEDEWF